MYRPSSSLKAAADCQGERTPPPPSRPGARVHVDRRGVHGGMGIHGVNPWYLAGRGHGIVRGHGIDTHSSRATPDVGSSCSTCFTSSGAKRTKSGKAQSRTKRIV